MQGPDDRVTTPADQLRAEEFDKRVAERLEPDREALEETESELRQLYLDEDLPARIIADRFQVSAAAINQRLRLWRIQKRTRRVPGAAESGGGEETSSIFRPPTMGASAGRATRMSI
jgi:hypothetical protein